MSSTKKILLIDDDIDLLEILADQLATMGNLEVVKAENGQTGLKCAKEQRFDLIILDIYLPDLDGREVCRQLRQLAITCPVILLTGQGSDSDLILGLDAGANDYVTKPFKLAVLLARVRAQLRQHENSEDANFAIGSFCFRPGEKMLLDQTGAKIRLTEKETNILKFLYRAGGRTVERETLLREVWGYNANISTHTLETHIYRLRQKIEPQSGGTQILLTEAGGYRLDI